MELESLIINSKLHLSKIDNIGTLSNTYKPFKNLIVDDVVSEFRTKNLKIDLNYPVNIEIQSSFDGSVNLILNNDQETPRLINSRFSAKEGDTYEIVDHQGNKDTNLYDNNQLDLDTRLYKTINKIPQLIFNGLNDNGKMKCGSYHFYFKLTDNDGNETDFISESGVVTCHIGNYKDPGSVRMGMLDENSNKSVSFTLMNLDSSYDYIKVYYTRTTSDNSQQDILTTNLVDKKFPIINSTVNLTISGFETHIPLGITDINPRYEIVDKVKAQAQCQGMLFFGNINKPNVEYNELKDLSLRFIPEIVSSKDTIGNIDGTYKDISGRDSYEYYNSHNIYYKLGYWPEEYYRLGIVYLLNDYTLSPVFNIRGLNFDESYSYSDQPLFYTSGERRYINTTEDGYLENGINSFENAAGVIKINKKQVIYNNGVNPLGIKLKIQYQETLTKLKKLTKGFFIVRQERIPTIYAQGVSISKTKDKYGNIPIIKSNNNYIAQHFVDETLKLAKTTKIVDSQSKLHIEGKASIIPEASIRNTVFEQLFTSNKYKLTKAYEQSQNNNGFTQIDTDHYTLGRNTLSEDSDIKEVSLTMVKDGLNLTTNGKDFFSAKAGNETQVWENVNIRYAWDYPNSSGKLNDYLTKSKDVVRGLFGTYVGLDTELPFNTIFNVRDKEFELTSSYILTMMDIRINSSEPYMAITDRISFDDVMDINNVVTAYRGDCYVNNFTHRINRNFIDPDLPTNTTIVDKNTWKTNYAVYSDSPGVNRQLLNYKTKDGGATIIEPSNPAYVAAGTGIGSLFATSDYKECGCTKINRSDVNAVPLGHWVTFKVMSNINLSMRDLDSFNPSEEAIHGHKRGFYPYGNNMSSELKLPDSSIINGGANVTLSKKPNFIIPDVPFIKNYFGNRILYSDLSSTDAFKNGYRVFSANHYKDYTNSYGAIVDIQEWFNNLFVTLEHGCFLIPVNERAIAGEGDGGNVYINTSNVLPENPRIISNLFGSTWQESVIKTKTGIYGVDTVAKKIWMSDGKSFNIISDLTVQRFLNENIDLRESNKLPTIGIRNVKTHYNKSKGDIMFTFYNENKEWNLCYNENLKKFITFYSWMPSYSANINNVFFSFNKDDISLNKLIINDNGDLLITEEEGAEDSGNIIISEDYTLLYNKWLLDNDSGDTGITENGDDIIFSIDYISGINGSKLWKHGQSGIYDNQGKVLPTNWYGEQHPFEFEFVVAENPMVQKIFNNLKLISNKAAPKSFEFEVVGEGYDWYEYKDIIVWINDKFLDDIFGTIEDGYKKVLSTSYGDLRNEYDDFPELFNTADSYKIKKIPYLPRERFISSVNKIGRQDYEWNTSNTKLITDDLLSEDKVHTDQIGNDLRKYGRVRGNMQYLEDCWDIEIKPIYFKYAYVGNGNTLKFTTGKEARIRDKYIKIRVKYSGTDLAIIQGIKTSFTQSFA